MSPYILFTFVLLYFIVLLGVAWYTSSNADNNSFFIGNRNSNWMLVAFGMIGTSLSGVTFVSVPGTVGSNGFAYFQVVMGNFIGYCLIAFILLPLYYKLNLTSIYGYLRQRFGPNSQAAQGQSGEVKPNFAQIRRAKSISQKWLRSPAPTPASIRPD